MSFQLDKRNGGRRWWRQWPTKASYDVSQGEQIHDGGLWDGDIRRYMNVPFNGYFQEIRDIANRTIPQKSPLSLSLSGGNITDRSDATYASTPTSAVTLQKYQKFMTESFEPDLNSPLNSPTSVFSSPFTDRKPLSLKSERDYDPPEKSGPCTRVERFLVGTSLYLAVAVLIMLIVTGVVVVLLRDINTSINNINVDDSQRSVQVPLATTQTSIKQMQTLLSSTKNSITTPRLETTTQTTRSLDKTTTIEKSTTSKSTTISQQAITSSRLETTTMATTTSKTSQPSTTTAQPITTIPQPTTTIPRPTTTTPEPTTITLITTTTKPKSTTTTPKPTTTTPQPTTTTPQPTTTTIQPTTTTPKPTTTRPQPTTTTPQPTITKLQPTTTTPNPTTTALKPTTTTPKPTTTTPQPTTTTPQPTTTTPQPTTTAPQPTTSTPQTTTTTPQPTTTKPQPTTTKPQPTTTTPKSKTSSQPMTSTTTQLTTTTRLPSTTLEQKTTTNSIMTTSSGNGDTLCDTSYCRELASNIKSYMNATADKCSDFYSFACGTWISSRTAAIFSEEIDNWKRSINDDKKILFNEKLKDVLELPDFEANTQYSRNLKEIYQTCLNTNSIYNDDIVMTELRLALNDLDFDNSLVTKRSIEELQYLAMYKYGTAPLLHYGIIPSGDSSLYSLELSPPSLYMKREVYDRPIDDSMESLLYLNQVSSFLNSLFVNPGGGDEGGFRRRRETEHVNRILLQYDENYDYDYDGDTLSMNDISQKLLDVLDFERQLHKIIPLSAGFEANTDGALQIPFNELKTRYPSLNWTDIFVDIDPNANVEVSNIEYFNGLNRILTETNSETIKLYELVSVILQGVWKFLPFEKRTMMSGLGSRTTEPYTWIHCVNLTSDLMNKELHREYATHMSGDIGQSVDDIKSVFTNITRVMMNYIKNATSFSVETWNALQNKMLTIKVKTIPIPQIDTSFVVRPSISFLFTAMDCLKKRYQEDMNRLGTVVSSDIITWSDLHSKYSTKTNTIELPLGLMSMINNTDPIFPVLSGIGSELATHVIQALYGNMRFPLSESWWSSISFSRFLGTWTCFDNQLSQGLSDGISYTGEVVKGDGALHLVLQEFNRQLSFGTTKRYYFQQLPYTTEQLFLLHFTQNFCEVPYDDSLTTNREKVNGILRNSNFFHQAFTCPVGTEMRPEQTCSLL